MRSRAPAGRPFATPSGSSARSASPLCSYLLVMQSSHMQRRISGLEWAGWAAFCALSGVALAASPFHWLAWVPDVSVAGALIVGFPLMLRPLGLARWLKCWDDRPLVGCGSALIYLLVALALVTPRLSWPGWIAVAALGSAVALVAALVFVAYRRQRHSKS